MRRILAALALAAAAFTAQPALAVPTSTQLALTSASVVATSGSYISNGYDFSAGNIFSSPPGTTSISETFGTGYWLAPGFTGTSSYITVALGGAYTLGSFTLFNTHNANFFDRGTGNFEIIAGNTLSGGQISGGTILVNSTLAAPSSDPISGQNFVSANTLASFTYIEFVALTVASINSPETSSDYGLDELQVFGNASKQVPVPEPGSLLLLAAGMVGVGCVVRRRRD